MMKTAKFHSEGSASFLDSLRERYLKTKQEVKKKTDWTKAEKRSELKRMKQMFKKERKAARRNLH